MVLTPEIAAGILTAVKEEYRMICGMTYFQICLYFLFYSFGGWVVEVIFHEMCIRDRMLILFLVSTGFADLIS